ncbi:hypothetical protein ATANTOWER_008027 [Ataeniobius toweri]|uniref:Uncharacterized protein n=1 Tax=Ataeniobius toweri TaxID=208326 RepID=A0ABU7CFB6_9TELE|nr:hypothetical protein [Ataeniobius toweri]
MLRTQICSFYKRTSRIIFSVGSAQVSKLLRLTCERTWLTLQDNPPGSISRARKTGLPGPTYLPDTFPEFPSILSPLADLQVSTSASSCFQYSNTS